MNFPTTTEEFLKTLAHGKEPTSEDRSTQKRWVSCPN